MKVRLAFIPLMMFVATAGWSQAPMKPGPELKKLDYFVGNWTTEGTIAQGPWGVGGKFTATAKNEWMTGDFFMLGHADFKMPAELGGDGTGTVITGYDTNQNVYTRDEFNSQGRRETSTGTLSGDTWTWNTSQNYGGQDIKIRTTAKTLSPTSFTIKVEVSMDGTNWMPFMDAKSTKK